ncbi:MAG: class I SAM-dependent methyltransferase [Chthoniobacterales bacterium]
MAKTDWKSFWSSYRKKEVRSEEDLYLEVGKTVNQRPISSEAFQLTIDSIIEALNLSQEDRLLELCCGNGLMTRRLAPLVARIQAVDFAEHLIGHAQDLEPPENVTYICADAADYLQQIEKTRAYVPTKVLLGDALGYFDPDSLYEMLRRIINLTNNSFVFLATSIPCDELKWSFYDTPERVRRYKKNQLLPGNTNDGVGRWWKKDELEQVGRRLDLKVGLRELPPLLSAFRIDAVFVSGRQVVQRAAN